MRSKLKLIGICAIVAVLLSVCGCTAANEVKSAAEAKDAALSYLREHNAQNAPSADIVWQEQDTTPPDWVGGVFKEFTSDEWIVKVSYPVVPLENTVYQVVVFNIKLGWHWKGTVEFDSSVTELSAFKQMSEEASQQIALDFLKKSPTFTFDGIENSIKLIRVEPAFCPYCWGFVYEFQCAHPGYGDRSGQILAQVITDHEAMIAVSMGEVDGGTINERWDMVNQREISGQPPEIKEEVTLEDTKWILQSYGEPGNLKDMLTNTEITAEFVSSEGTVKGSAGCNSYFGSYELKGSQLSIPGPVGVTEMYCMGPEGIMDQEQEYLAALQLAESYEIDGDELLINCGSQALIFKSD